MNSWLAGIGPYSSPIAVSLAGALVTIVAYYVGMPTEIQGAVHTLASALLALVLRNVGVVDGSAQ